MTVYDVVVWDGVGDMSSLFQGLKSKLSQTFSWSRPSSLLVNLRWTASTERISMT